MWTRLCPGALTGAPNVRASCCASRCSPRVFTPLPLSTSPLFTTHRPSVLFALHLGYILVAGSHSWFADQGSTAYGEGMGTKNKGVFGGPVNENNHPREFAGLTGKTTALDNGNRVLLGIPGVGAHPAAALALAPLGSSLVARLAVPTKRMASARPQVRGKFIFVGDEKLYVRGVTYGTFRPNDEGEEFPAP